MNSHNAVNKDIDFIVRLYKLKSLPEILKLMLVQCEETVEISRKGNSRRAHQRCEGETLVINHVLK